MKKILIIGGMAAGCKAAARLKRINPKFDVKIIEKNSFLSYGTCGMPLFASGDVDSFLDLAKTPWGKVRNEDYFLNAKDIKTLCNTECLEIFPNNKKIACRNIISGENFELNYDILLLATGAKPIKLPIAVPISDKISYFHSPLDAKKFRNLAQTGKIGSAIIIGGGYIGCELSEALVSMWGIDTILIEKENRLLPGFLDDEISFILEKQILKNDIKILKNSFVKKFDLTDEGNPFIEIDSNKFEADYLFICAGVEPNTELAIKAGLQTGKFKGITVNNKMETSIPNIYAAGDCIEVKNLITNEAGYFPLGSLSNRQGRTAADSISGINASFKGAVGNVSMKIFGLITAVSGLSEKKANALGIDVDSITGTFFDRPDYHPDSKTLYAKLVYEKNSLRLIGLQLAGMGEVTRYIDVFSEIAGRGGTIYDLIEHEHAYNPPHSGPINPLNFLGFMAQSQEIDGIRCIKKEEYLNSNATILDLREKYEIEKSIENSINFTIEEYRFKIDNLDKNQSYITVCQKGSRSYEAARYIKNLGFKDVGYLGGGIQMLDGEIDEVD